jgi:hypothetical protein
MGCYELSALIASIQNKRTKTKKAQQATEKKMMQPKMIIKFSSIVVPRGSAFTHPIQPPLAVFSLDAH